MKTRIQSAPLGQQVPAGHADIGKITSLTQAAREWARNNPDPAGMWAQRRNKKTRRGK